MTDPQLIQRIVAAVVAQLDSRREPPCSCHSATGGCCPDRMGAFVGRGAQRFGLNADAQLYPAEIARMTDHTLLKPDATRAQIETLCREAREHSFATVCVNPTWVGLASELLKGQTTRVCTVIGFPLGATFPETKADEATRAIAAGASEIDMVANVGALKSRDFRLVARDIEGVAQVCRDRGAISKVIIETALLDDDEKVRACVLVRAAGADFVKTSTGFASGGATVADVELMRRVVGPELGVKAAGGVRDFDSAKEMIRAGADRIGASVGVKIVTGGTAASGAY